MNCWSDCKGFKCLVWFWSLNPGVDRSDVGLCVWPCPEIWALVRVLRFPNQQLWVVSPCTNLRPSTACAQALCWGVTVECKCVVLWRWWINEWVNLRWMDKWIRYYMGIALTPSFILQIITRMNWNGIENYWAVHRSIKRISIVDLNAL